MSPNQDEAAQRQQADRSPSDQRKPSLPSISTVHSPEQHHVSLPQYTPPPNRSSPPQAQDAVQALTKLSASNAPPPTQWGDHSAPEDVQRRESHDRRPGSAHSTTIELPPPPPLDAQRNMSSPTLDQYHVASRSPEQRRASLVLPSNAAFTLPPLQNVTSPIDGQMRRPSLGSNHDMSPTSARAAHVPPGSAVNADESEKVNAHAEPSTSQAPVPSLVEPSTTAKEGADEMSPAHIKQENLSVPQPASPIDARRPSLQTSDMEPSKTISSLKLVHLHGRRGRSTPVIPREYGGSSSVLIGSFRLGHSRERRLSSVGRKSHHTRPSSIYCHHCHAYFCLHVPVVCSLSGDISVSRWFCQCQLLCIAGT